MAEFDLGQLLRLEEAIKAAAGTDTEPDGASAVALTESYMRLRGQVLKFVKGSDLEAEFESTFPEIKITERPPSDPFEVQAAIQEGKFPARQAQSLLAQLAGWIGGIVREMTLEQQMRLDAEARAKQAAKQPPGFTAEP
jgi:hypothetical protein